MSTRVALEPDRMTNVALFERAKTILAACRFPNGLTPRERERLFDELLDVLLTLQGRDCQPSLF